MKRIKQIELGKALQAHQQRMMVVNAIQEMALVPSADELGKHGHIVAVNADLLSQGTYREALTTYAVGYRVGTYEQDLELMAPGVQVGNRFEYKAFSNPEAFLSELDDDARAPGADFKSVEYTSEEVLGKTQNRGLMLAVDRDQVIADPNWEERYTAMLTTRLLLNKLRRAINLLSAAAVNQAKTWNADAGKNPDGDVREQIRLAHTAAGVRPNRAAYGPTAWDLRVSSHEAQNNAGGYAAAGRTPQQVAQYLSLESVLVQEARYATSLTAKAEALSNLVLLYNALTGATVEDPSNIKGFWSPCDNGQKLMVHRWDIGPKKYCIAVEHYELTAITSTLGIRKITVS